MTASEIIDAIHKYGLNIIESQKGHAVYFEGEVIGDGETVFEAMDEAEEVLR